jgi:hypothetical protein
MHRVLERVIRAEAARMPHDRRPAIVAAARAVWLPVSGARLYREGRRFLRSSTDAAAEAVRVRVVDIPGSNHVLLVSSTATSRGPVGTRALRRYGVESLSSSVLEHYHGEEA